MEAIQRRLDDAVDVLDGIRDRRVWHRYGVHSTQATDLDSHGLGMGQGGTLVRSLQGEAGLPAQQLEQLPAAGLGRIGAAVDPLALGDAEAPRPAASAVVGQDALLEWAEALVDGAIGLAEYLVVHVRQCLVPHFT